MVGGTQFSPWQGLRGESGPNWHSTIRVPAAARDKRPDDSPVVFRSAGTGRRGGRGRSMARERVATAITRRPLAGRASEPPRARRSAGPSASSPCPSPSAPQRHTFTPSWKTPPFPPPSGLSLGELLSGLRLEPPTHLDAATPRRHPATGPSQSR